jgi:DNA-binding response OmpR family regulator
MDTPHEEHTPTAAPNDNAPAAPADPGAAMKGFLVKARSAIREPLTGIAGYTYMLLEDAARAGAEAVLPDLRRIEDAGRRLGVVVDGLLDSATVDRYLAAGDLERTASAMRHDLRTPLNAIIGYSELLLEDVGTVGTLAVGLDRVRSGALTLLAIVDDLFSITSLERATGQKSGKAGRATRMLGGVMAASAPRSDATPLRGDVLIVDDNEGNRDVLAHRLEREGCKVVAVDGGAAALELLATRSFDLVLLDVLMPEMNGLEVLARLRASEQFRELPVVMLSALDQTESIVRCLELGADDFLPKPFNPVMLRARIGACLERKRLRDAEVEYLRAVAAVTDAAGAIEAGTFEVESLTPVAERDDALGRLARVFEAMAKEVYTREQRLKNQVAQLKIEIDQAKMARQVSDITETDYFRQLRLRAKDLRKGTPRGGE